MKLAVVTYPDSERRDPSLATDVELVCASILYADEMHRDLIRWYAGRVCE